MSSLAELSTAYGAASPHELFARMREERPISQVRLPNGVPVWMVTRHADARAALGDPRLSTRIGAPLVAEALPPEIRAGMGTHMLRVDGADHTRLRRLVSSVFTARRIEGLRPVIEEMTGELLDTMAESEHPDVIRDLAFPLPLRVIYELLGVPHADRKRFSAWSNTYLTGIGTQTLPVEVITEFVTYLRELVAQKRAEPDDRLLSAMLVARDHEDRLSEDELTSMCFLLIVAGYETVMNFIGIGALILLSDRELADRLRADPEAMAPAVEEFLRFESPTPGASFRIATEPLTLAGQAIGKGELVSISLLSANRDEAVFADPHRLRADRGPTAHLAFGHGIHYCLGAALSRLEARVALGRLLDRFPEIALLDPAAPPKWWPGFVVRGLSELPVTLGRPARPGPSRPETA